MRVCKTSDDARIKSKNKTVTEINNIINPKLPRTRAKGPTYAFNKNVTKSHNPTLAPNTCQNLQSLMRQLRQ